MFGKTLLHECLISSSYIEWYLLFSLSWDVLCFVLGVLLNGFITKMLLILMTVIVTPRAPFGEVQHLLDDSPDGVPESTARSCVHCTLQALHSLHARHIAHLDVKVRLHVTLLLINIVS